MVRPAECLRCPAEGTAVSRLRSPNKASEYFFITCKGKRMRAEEEEREVLQTNSALSVILGWLYC